MRIRMNFGLDVPLTCSVYEVVKLKWLCLNLMDFQEKIIDYLKTIKGIKVTERIEEFPEYMFIKDYRKTVIIEPM